MENESLAASLQRDGYLRIPQLIGGDALAEAREHCRRLLAGEIACGGDDRQLGGRVRQIVLPSRHHPWFAGNPVISAARALCAQIWQTPAQQVAMFFDMVIAKDPGNTAATPWHQDFAYDQMPCTPPGVPIPNRRLQFWVAMDDVDGENGCMHFIPGSHRRPSLPHYVYSGAASDPARLLATDAYDASRAVVCPLPAGGATAHYEGTLHYTSGNRTTDRPRRAYIFALETRQGQ